MTLPAWAEAFLPGRLAPSPRFELPVDRDWAYGDATGRGVKVAVVDSGVDAAHPRVRGVAGAVLFEADPEHPGTVRRVDGPHDDVFGHGTACAGIVRELAPDVELWSVRVLGPRLTGKAYVVGEAVAWCLEQGMQVVNLSLSTANDDYFGAFHELCDEAAHAGMCIVGAMNNERRSSYPSEYAAAFSVACAPGTDREVLTWNPSPPAEWGAAGIDVEVAWLGGSTITATGNSFAAPVVTGHVARVLGTHPGLKPFQVKAVLAALARHA
jgi:subtilisin family serine protease